MNRIEALKKPRVNAIEYMRGISMLGVVGIHVGSQYIVNASANIHLIAVFEILTRFSVPIFFFISAFGLFYNLDMNEPLNYKQFMKKRFKTVLVPYIAWSFLYIMLNFVRSHNFALFNPLYIASTLFFGLACYQLYFMVILIWFYMLMPLWIYMVKKSNRRTLTILLILQIIFDYYSSFIMNPYGIANPIIKDLLVYRLNYWVLHYVFIFILGGYIGVHFKAFQSFMEKNRGRIAVFFILSSVWILAYYYYCLFIKHYTALEAINTAHQLCPAGIIYTIGATIFLFSEFYNVHWSKTWENIFSQLGRHSYFAYLCHPVFISIFAAVMIKLNLIMTASASIIFYIATVAAAVAAAAVCRNFSQKYCAYINILTIGSYPKRR